MASNTADKGTGITVTFGTSAFSQELIDVEWSGISRESIETTHTGVAVAAAGKFGNRTFIPGDLVDPGELTLTFNFNPDRNPGVAVVAAGATETITIRWLDSGDVAGATWAGSGFFTSYSVSCAMEEKMTATMTVKLTGNVTVTADA